MITLDQIEQLMNRTGADYQTVRDALKATDGDMFKALLLVEEAQQKGTRPDTGAPESDAASGYGQEDIDQEASTEDDQKEESKEKEPTASDILETLRKLLRDFNATKIMIRKDGHTVLDISATIGAIGLILAPVAAVIGLGAAVVTDYELILVLADGRELNVNQIAKDQLNDISAGFETYTSRQREKRDNYKKDRKVAEEEGYTATYEAEAGSDDETEATASQNESADKKADNDLGTGMSHSPDADNDGTGQFGTNDPRFTANQPMGGFSDDTGRTGYPDDPGFPDDHKGTESAEPADEAGVDLGGTQAAGTNQQGPTGTHAEGNTEAVKPPFETEDLRRSNEQNDHES